MVATVIACFKCSRIGAVTYGKVKINAAFKAVRLADPFIDFVFQFFTERGIGTPAFDRKQCSDIDRQSKRVCLVSVPFETVSMLTLIVAGVPIKAPVAGISCKKRLLPFKP